MAGIRIFRACAVLALLAAGCTTDPPRVMVLGLDGMDPEAVDLLISQGKMPHFARLRAGGAYGRLASQEPLLSPVIWITIATGKTAGAHRLGYLLAVHPNTDEPPPVTSEMRQVNALWNIFSAAGRDVGVVGWWATWPAEKVRGAIVSDHTCDHFLFADAFQERADVAGLVHPPPLWDEIERMVQRPTAVGRERLLRFADVEATELERPIRFDDDLAHLRWALAAAATYHDIGLYLWKKKRPQLLMVYVEAPDRASHLFGHLFGAQELAGELAEQQRRYGRTVEAMYRYADQIVGSFVAAMDSRTTLLVLSDHGFELGVLPQDPGKLRDLRRVSERFHRPYGILYLYGHQVKAGVSLQQPAILDIAPTVLALAGLPVAQDMRGRVLLEGLELERAPVTVATYETKPVEETAVRASRLDEAVLERLRSLGYLKAEPPLPARRQSGGDRGTEKSAGDRTRQRLVQDESRTSDGRGKRKPQRTGTAGVWPPFRRGI